MNNAKWLSMLGLARRAGKLAMGHDLALQSVRDGKAQLVLTARNASPRLLREFETAGQKRAKAPRMRALPCTIDEIHFALGYRAGVLTVEDAGFAARIEELLQQEEKEWS